MRPRRLLALAAAASACGSAGCELEEITLVEAEDVVVAEVLVSLHPGVEGRDRLTAFLHRTVQAGGAVSAPVPGARVIVTRSDGLSLELGETDVERCVVETPVMGSGTCYWAAPEHAALLEPGDLLALTIELPDGRELRGETRVPGAFSVAVAPSEGFCSVAPDAPLEIVWTRSEGARAYVDETLISGLPAALAPRGITDVDDPLYLLGLSVSASDTTIVFPGEFGIFDRFDLDRGLSVALQAGLPEGTEAKVTITAVDANYVNWTRGGSFNPSGRVRVPSVRGDGTGVFAATVSHGFRVYASEVEGVPRCGLD